MTVQQVWDDICRDPKLHCLITEMDGVFVASCILAIIPNLTRGARSYGLIENVVTHASYRRQGIGSTLATQLFDTHHGYWEVTIVGPNTPAQAFWRKVVNTYAKGRYRDFTTQEDDMDIIWLTFDISQP